MSLRLLLVLLVACLAGCSAGRGLSSVEGFDKPCVPDTPSLARADSLTGTSEEPPILLGGRDSIEKRMRYPTEARRKELEGQICLLVTVDEEGEVESVEVARSIHPLLDAEAVRAVMGSKFKPARRNGEPVESRLSLTMRYTLIGGTDTTRLIGSIGAVSLMVLAVYFVVAVPSD